MVRPRTPRAHARPPDAGEPDGQRGVVRTVLVAAAVLALAALLDAEALHHTASTQPLGWRRDLAMDVMDPVLDLSRALHLTAPRQWLEDAFDRPSTRPPPPTTAPVTTRPPGSSSTSLPGATSVPGPTGTTSTTAPVRRTPTAADPLRLLIAGDSMTESTGPALLDLADADGRIDAAHELRYSSGLTRPDYFDWPATLARLVAEQRPEAIVVMLGANDAQGIQTPNGPASFGSDAWIEEYRGRVAATMSLLDADGRVVYWIGEPVMREGGYDQRMALITDIYRAEAERHAGVRFVATRSLFADAAGDYSAYLPGPDGQPALVRREDGIHLTAAGADRLARAIMAVVADEWDLDG